MTRIEVERKGWPIWAWIVLALIVIGLIWALLAARDRDREGAATMEPGAMAGEAGREATREADGMTGSITGLSMLIDPADPDRLAGRSVRIENARVLSVTGDKTFWIGEAADHQVLVVLDEQRTSGQPATEGRYDVQPGQVVTVMGDVQRFPGWDEARARWNIDPSLRSEFEGRTVYIHARQLEITHRP